MTIQVLFEKKEDKEKEEEAEEEKEKWEDEEENWGKDNKGGLVIVSKENEE